MSTNVKSKAPAGALVKAKETGSYQCTSSMDVSPFTNNNLYNHTAQSEVSHCMKDLECWMGIDEAGRGPVLGPMVYGICYSPLANKDDLKTMGFADSKTLSEEQRDSMFDDLNSKPDKIGWMVNILSPHYISNCMLRRTKYNLNELSHDTAIGLIQRAIDQGVNVTQVYLDTVGPPDKYQKKLEGIFPNLSITVSKKADSLYSIVSAASICAKVARDKAVSTWKFTERVTAGDDCGSGYPADPKTKDFLSSNIDKVFGFPKIVRFSWSTAAKLLEQNAHAAHWVDDEEEENSKSKKRKAGIDIFIGAQNTGKNVKSQSFRYYTERKLSSCTEL